MKRLNAETTLSLLLALSLFTLAALGVIRQQNQQTHTAQLLFQQQQALSIADNQIERQLAQFACERTVIQNGIRFEIEKCSPQQIHVSFPLGVVRIEKGKSDK